MYKLYCHYTDGGCFYIVDERDSGLWGATSSGAVALAAGWLVSTADQPLLSSTSDAAAQAAFFMGVIPHGVARYPFLRVGKNAVSRPMSGR